MSSQAPGAFLDIGGSQADDTENTLWPFLKRLDSTGRHNVCAN